jgi:hypothetical protein
MMQDALARLDGYWTARGCLRVQPMRHCQLVGLLGDMGMVGSAGSIFGVVGQAAVVVPVIWFQVVNRLVISRRYSWAESR